MGNYRQHITFASTLGIGYSAAAYAMAGLHWMYGSVAVLLSTLGGLLPDLDSPSGVELKGFTGILGVFGAVAVWQEVGLVQPPPAFELHLWLMVGTFVLIRHGLRRVMYRLTVHRGISHSIPTMLVWAEITYLTYPTESHPVRLMMALAVGLGFFSHLLLDEICSVDLRGVRVNKAFGTALKLWAPSMTATLGIYALLSVLTYQVIRRWPDRPLEHGPELTVPDAPDRWHLPAWASWSSTRPGATSDPGPDRGPTVVKAPPIAPPRSHPATSRVGAGRPAGPGHRVDEIDAATSRASHPR